MLVVAGALDSLPKTKTYKTIAALLDATQDWRSFRIACGSTLTSG